MPRLPWGFFAADSSGAVAVHLHTLLTGFQHDPPTLVADATLAAAATLYLAAVRRLRRQGRSWPVSLTAMYLAGLLAIFVAIGSGLAAYDDDNFSAHVVQHVLLMMVGPPLIVLGRPVTVFMQAGSRRTQRVLVSAVRSRAVGVLTGPASFLAYYGFMWSYFLTPLYPWSEHWQALHDAIHVVFVALGLCFWQYVAGPDRYAGQPSHLRRVAAIVVGMPLEMYLGFTLHSLDHSLGPGTTTSSVQAGGEVFWWLTMLVSGIALALAIGQWVLEDERAARRLDAVSERQATPTS